MGQTDVPGNPRYYSRTVVTSAAGAGNHAFKFQPIEDARILSGRTVTVSFWAKADASKDMAVEWYRYYGSGGSPSSTEEGDVLGNTKFSLTTSWQKFSYTATLTSVSGKTFGTDNNSWVSPILWFEGGSSFDSRNGSLGQQSGTFDIAQVQVEIGDNASEQEIRPLGEEILLCQRYYCKSYDIDVDPATATNVGNLCVHANDSGGFYFLTRFPVAMRSSPTVTPYSPATGASGKARAFSTDYNASGFEVGKMGCRISGTSASNGGTFCHFTADAEL